jgi:hypothetical protein
LQIGNSIKRSASYVPIAFALIFFVAAFFAGISSGVATSFGHLAPNITGAAAAISSQVFGLKGHPYEAYDSVLKALYKGGIEPIAENYPQNFHNYTLLSSALRSAQSVDVAGSPLVSVTSDDQGGIEYTHAAFLLFGIDVKSLYYFYFVILGVSVAAYLLSFWRDYVACTVLFAAACAIYSFMPGWLFDNTGIMSVANERFLSTLGIIPMLHIAFLVVRGDATLHWSSIASTVIQAGILSFAYAARGTALWMLLALLVLAAFYLARVLGPTFKQKTLVFVSSVMRRRGVVVFLALTMVVAINLGRRVFLLPRSDIHAHPVWHNIFIGFQYSANWMTRYGAQYDFTTEDQLSFWAARMYVETHHLPPITTWAMHEAVMRSVIIEFIEEHPRFALESFLFYRPHTFLPVIQNFSTAVYSSVPAYVFIVILGMCCCLGILGSASLFQRNSLTFWSAMCVLVLSFVVSLDSVFVFYSHPAVVSDQAFLFVAIIVSLSIWTFTKASQLTYSLTCPRS